MSNFKNEHLAEITVDNLMLGRSNAFISYASFTTKQGMAQIGFNAVGQFVVKHGDHLSFSFNNPATAIEMIAEERKRQIEKEGYTPENDIKYTKGDLCMAAVAYAMPSLVYPKLSENFQLYIKRECFYPWVAESFKPTPEDRIRELVKAGALIVAEIERLQVVENIKNV